MKTMDKTEKKVVPFWMHVKDMDDGSGQKQCVFCKHHKFAKDTSIWRIKCHLSGERGRGVAICDKVPTEVQEAAFNAIFGARKRQKSPASSSNVDDDAMQSLPQEKNNEINIAGGFVQPHAQGLEQRVTEQRTSFPAEAGNYLRNIIGVGAEDNSAEGYLLDSLPIEDMVVDQFPEWFIHNDQLGPLLHPINEHENFLNNAISTCPQEQNRGVENLGEDTGRVLQQQALGSEQGVTEERTYSGGAVPPEAQGVEQRVEARTFPIAEADHHMENRTEIQMTQIDQSISPQKCMVDAQEIQGEACQTTDFVSQLDLPWQDLLTNIESHLMEEEDVQKGIGTVLQPAAGASSSRGFPHNTSNKTTGDVFPVSSTRVVGEAFEDNKKLIWSWLMNDEVSSIGIYGMGGVGKTTLVKHIYGQLSSIFCHVYWITVSQDSSISRLQNLIAKRIGLDLSNEDEEWCKAAILFKELMKKQKWVLIFDDLWDHFELHKVGIPIHQKKGCKLILTTRSLRVCRKIDCQEMIKVKPLSSTGAWSLFKEKLGPSKILSLEVAEIAKSIIEQCNGLPLGIVTMAGTMNGIVDIREWRNALKELKESKVRKDEMGPEVFKILKFSYNHLNDSALQQCFLYCALFPEDYKIDREVLIYFLINEGMIEGMQSLLEQFDKGHAMLNKLEDICLLESCFSFGDRAVKMHDLIRDMALQILQENSHVMVKAGEQLKELPNVEDWNVNLVRVSLMQNHIREIPKNHAPRCPYLSTLLLCENYGLQFIADSFFNQFHKLKVLDLSDTSIKNLPDSVSDLVTLDALLLSGCKNLRRMPSMKKLRVLRRLDLGDTKLENFPIDMEWLSNLRYLRFGGCDQKEFPIGILPKLSNLRVFTQEVTDFWEDEELQVKGKEVACLRKLELLQCNFKNLSDLVEYLNFRDKTHSLSSYGLFIGQWIPFEEDDLEDYSCKNKIVALGKLPVCKDRDLQVLFSNDMKKLLIGDCDDAISFISSSIKNATELEVIEIRNCDAIESLLSSYWFCSAPLEQPSSHCLKKLICYRCGRMKKLFPLVLLPNLVNLEEIRVRDCCNLEEIIGTTDDVGDMGEECSSNRFSVAEFSLPKLRSLELEYLPELKSICSTKLKCNSLQQISVRRCRKLKRMPFSLPLLDNGQPSLPPPLWEIYMDKETWELVEWVQPNAKDVLLPLVNFWL